MTKMGSTKIAASKELLENWGASFKECGMDYYSLNSPQEAFKTKADFFFIDARQNQWLSELPKLKEHTQSPIMVLISNSIKQKDLSFMKAKGVEGVIAENTPPEEIVLRLQAMLKQRKLPKEILPHQRGAERVWFQQEVDFTVFDRNYKAWSMTLSETGIFLHTTLTFPLYSRIHLRFKLWGRAELFECVGVIIRHEVEEDVVGIGVMFQNLKGEDIQVLQSFLELYQ